MQGRQSMSSAGSIPLTNPTFSPLYLPAPDPAPERLPAASTWDARYGHQSVPKVRTAAQQRDQGLGPTHAPYDGSQDGTPAAVVGVLTTAVSSAASDGDFGRLNSLDLTPPRRRPSFCQQVRDIIENALK